jgi:hypothetical protein
MQANGSTGGLLQGVSQQPVNVRQPGQCTEQINAVSDVVQGWKRRPPTDYIAQLFADAPENIKWSFYDTGTEHYILCFVDGEVRVFDLAGNQKTVTNSGLHSYLDTASPDTSISTITIGDYTIVANSEVLPSLTADKTLISNTTIVVVRAGEYGRTYRIEIDGVARATYTTPAGDTPASQASQTGAEYIASRLQTSFTSLAPGALRQTVILPGSQNNMPAELVVHLLGVPLATPVVTVNGVAKTVTLDTGDVGFPIWFFAPNPECFFTTKDSADLLALNQEFYGPRLHLYNPLLTPTEWIIDYSVAGFYSEAVICARYGNTLLFSRAGEVPFNLVVSDDKNNTLAYAIRDSTDKVASLPQFTYNAHVVKISGATTGDDDAYYKFTSSGAFGSLGSWVETAAPGLANTLDANTLPHALIRLPSGSFYFGPIDGSTQGGIEIERWLRRDAGDSVLNPNPAFIGAPIRGLGTYQNRLVILAGESLNMSRTNSFFSFWRETASALLDTDPISIQSTYGEYSPLVYAMQHNRSLVLLSNRVQFIVKGTSGVTPKNAAIEVSTAFEVDLLSPPVVTGENLFFGIQKGTYAGLRELFTQSDIDSNTTRPVTDHIERYMPGRVRSMASSANLDTLVVNTAPATNFLYVYKYLWQGAERVQSAWSKWQFPGEWDVVYTFFNDAYLYIVYQDTGGTHLTRMDMTDLPLLGLTHNLYLDARLQVTPTAGAVTLPYAEYGDVVVVAGPDAADPGRVVQVLDSTAGVLALDWDEEGSVVVGKAMRTSYIPTIAGVKDSQGRYMANAELVLGELLVHYRNSGGFVGKLSSPFYDDVEVVADRSAGELSSELAGNGEDSDVFRMPVYMKADKNLTVEFYTDGVLPWNMLDIEWVGQYTRKGWRA